MQFHFFEMGTTMTLSRSWTIQLSRVPGEGRQLLEAFHGPIRFSRAQGYYYHNNLLKPVDPEVFTFPAQTRFLVESYSVNGPAPAQCRLGILHCPSGFFKTTEDWPPPSRRQSFWIPWIPSCYCCR
jgi:hypothetical protein